MKTDEYMLARAISIAQQTNTRVFVIGNTIGRVHALLDMAKYFESSLLEGVTRYSDMTISFPKGGVIKFVVMPTPEVYHCMGGWQITHAFLFDHHTLEDVAVLKGKLRAPTQMFWEPMGIYNKNFVERMEDY